MTGLYIQFSDCGKHIRKWSRQRFDEANAFAYRTQPDGHLPADEVEVAARAAARALGFDFDEVCGHETEAEECDSSTCIGGLNEEHHPDDCRETMRKIARAVALAGSKTRVDRDAYMAATQQPPRQLTRGSSGCTLEPLAGAQSDEAIRHLQIRSPLNRAIYQALRDHRLSNMGDEEGYPYPLLDLMSNPAPSDISTGEFAMVALADEVCVAVEAMSTWQPIETAPKDGVRVNLCWKAYGGLPAHVELGKWSPMRRWCNTYGHPFNSDPDFWMPLPSAPSQIGES